MPNFSVCLPDAALSRRWFIHNQYTNLARFISKAAVNALRPAFSTLRSANNAFCPPFNRDDGA
jgi:hypothetical protein